MRVCTRKVSHSSGDAVGTRVHSYDEMNANLLSIAPHKMIYIKIQQLSDSTQFQQPPNSSF